MDGPAWPNVTISLWQKVWGGLCLQIPTSQQVQYHPSVLPGSHLWRVRLPRPQFPRLQNRDYVIVVFQPLFVGNRLSGCRRLGYSLGCSLCCEVSGTFRVLRHYSGHGWMTTNEGASKASNTLCSLMGDPEWGEPGSEEAGRPGQRARSGAWVIYCIQA